MKNEKEINDRIEALNEVKEMANTFNLTGIKKLLDHWLMVLNWVLENDMS